MSTLQRLNRLLPLLLIALIGVVVWLNAGRQQTPPHRVNCPDLRQGCTARAGGREIRIGVDREIKALQPFELRVEAAGAGGVEARFTMEGMDMGFNIYTLRADDQGVFRARVTLPVCVSGSRDWLMTLDLDGTRLVVPFVTKL